MFTEKRVSTSSRTCAKRIDSAQGLIHRREIEHKDLLTEERVSTRTFANSKEGNEQEDLFTEERVSTRTCAKRKE